MDGDSRVTRTIDLDGPTLVPSAIRIGRDPDQCDVVLPSATERDRTVSRCHIEIKFDPAEFGFYLHNLKDNNPVYLNDKAIGNSTPRLTPNCTIRLGYIELQVEGLPAVPATEILQGTGKEVTRLITPPDLEPAPPKGRNMPPTGPIQTDDGTDSQGNSKGAAVKNKEPKPTTPEPSPISEGKESDPEPAVGDGANAILDSVKNHLFSCPHGHKYPLDEAKELGWICKYDGLLITSTFVAK